MFYIFESKRKLKERADHLEKMLSKSRKRERDKWEELRESQEEIMEISSMVQRFIDERRSKFKICLGDGGRIKMVSDIIKVYEEGEERAEKVKWALDKAGIEERTKEEKKRIPLENRVSLLADRLNGLWDENRRKSEGEDINPGDLVDVIDASGVKRAAKSLVLRVDEESVELFEGDPHVSVVVHPSRVRLREKAHYEPAS